MRQVTVTADNSGDTPAVVLDQYITPFQVTYSKTGSGTVQVSTADPYPLENGNFVAPTFGWISAPTTAPNTTSLLAQPFRAIRVTGGTAGDTLTVIQSGVK